MSLVLPLDEAVQNVTNEFGKEVNAMMNNVIGRTLVHLDGDRFSCRKEECNMGKTTVVYLEGGRNYGSI